MTSFTNIGTLLFGTYDTDLSRLWAGDKASAKIIDNGGINGLKFKKGQLHGLGTSLGLKEDEISEILSKNKAADARLKALMQKANVNENSIANTLDQNLKNKYGIAKATDFRNVSYINRFKTNFKIARKNDMIYRLLNGEKNVFKGFGAEITKAGAGKTGLAKFGAQAGKVLGKSMPLVGAALTLGFEIPNVFKSFRDYGAGEGLKQTGRAAFNLAGFAAGAAAGAAIGSAVPILGNIVGGLIGGMVGAFAGKTIFGKSKVEKQEEIEGLGLQKEQAQQMVEQGYDAEELQKVMAAQQQQQPQFGYQAPQAQGYNPYAQTQSNPFFKGATTPTANFGISLGDDNMMANSMSAYKAYQMVA